MEIFGVAWENLVVGIGAALLVGAVIRAKDVAYNKYLERQYPIEGEYITTWEQEIDGETVTKSAPATLSQRGKEVTGRSEMPDSDIEWIFEGEISETGYLNGLYYSSNPHNTSIGNFFFHINHDGELEGLWSGYQERNQTLNSGRYRFVPVLDAYSLHPVRRRDIPAAVDIAEQQLEKENGSGKLLSRTVQDDSEYFGHTARIDTGFESERSLAANLSEVLLADSPKIGKTGPGDPVASEVIGFYLGSVVDQEGFRAWVNASDSDLPKALLHADRVGILDTVAVKEGFETRGIGTALVQQWLDECVEQEASALCAVGWETDSGVNIDGIMEYFGFRAIARIDDYWRDESEDGDFQCKACTAAQCSCTAVVYARYQPSVDVTQ